jgi:uncharacterized protein (TIGR02996 family)
VAESEREQFLAEILANPSDMAPRLIFADWLEEQGDPRGEFIRIQLELSEASENYARREELDERQDQLRRAHEAEWCASLKGKVTGYTFGGGFVESVEMTYDQAIRHSDDLAKLIPLRRLIVSRGGRVNDRLFSLAILRTIETLRVEQMSLDPNLRGEPPKHPLANLQHLAVVQSHLTDDDVRTILKFSMPRLVYVDFSSNELRNSAAELMASHPIADQLQSLSLYDNQIRVAGAMALVNSPRFQSLQFLDLERNKLTEKTQEALYRRFGDKVRL